ncbi:MAG: uridine kinase [Armatimonadetes bacterium]|nr:uridine kinase [Armatimonadota bacterium]
MGRAASLIVGIAGGSGSGKTTLVRSLRRLLKGVGVSLLHHDDYYRDQSRLPIAQRATLNFDAPAALDNRRFARDAMALREGRSIEAPRYCFRTHARLAGTQRVRPAEVVIVEGMLLLAAPSVRELLEVRVFVDAPADLRLARRIRRDVGPARGRTLRSVLAQYEATVRPMHAKHVEPSRKHAEVVVTDALDERQVERVAALIRRRLAR